MSAKWVERMFSVSDLTMFAETQCLQMLIKCQETTVSHYSSITLMLDLEDFICCTE